MRRKTRTRQHIIADLSVNFIERHFLLAGHTAQRVEFDYGYDLIIQTFNGNGEIESGFLLIQVKASDAVQFVSNGLEVALILAKRDLEFWIEDTSPVVLICYDAAQEAAYWLAIQTLETAMRVAGTLGETITLRIPVENRVDAPSVELMRRLKNETFGGIRPHGPHL